MSKIQISILIILCCAFLLTACQATPDESVVIGKGDGQLEEKISRQTDSPLPSDMPQSGTQIKQAIKHDSLDITIELDALVDTQDGKTMPAAKVTPYKFTQEDVDRVYEYFVGDAHFFRIPDGEEWDYLAQKSIENWEKRLEFAENSEYYSDDHIQRIRDNIESARQDYLYAKQETDFEAVSHTLCKENLVFGGDLTEGVYGYFKSGEYAYRLGVVNDENGMSSEMFIRRVGGGDEMIYQSEMGSDIEYMGDGESIKELSYEDAFAQARLTADVFGADEMMLAHEEAVQYPTNTYDSYYTFVFTHQIDGVPCLYNAIAIANDEGYNDIWDYEQLRIEVDRNGIRSAAWYYPLTIAEQLAQSASLISFEQVMDCFSKMVFIKNSWLENDLNTKIYLNVDYSDDPGEPREEDAITVGKVIVHIKNIKLGLMRVQSGMDFLLIPVWDFYGYRERFTPEGEDIDILSRESTGTAEEYRPIEYCMLTINALDGSVIDLQQGY